METTIIQVPVSKVLRNQALKAAEENGFSSIQDAIRLFLTKLARKQVAVNIEETAIPLSWKNEKRYLKMDEDFDKDRNVRSFTSVEALMKDLRS